MWECVQRSSCARVSTSVYGASSPGLCTMCFYGQAGACVDELMRASLYICTVRAHKGFVILCLCLRLYGARSKGLCVMRTHTGFIQCAGARPPELCTKCLCACAGACADERVCTHVRCEPTKASCFCSSVYVCTVRAQKGFVRCEPIRDFYSVLVLAHQSFVPSAYMLVRERV